MSAPAVAVSEDGKKFSAAWKDMRAGEPNVYWSLSEQPRFDHEERVHDVTEGTQDHPSLVIDRRGRTWVAWEDGRGGRHDVWVRSSAEEGHGRAITRNEKLPASYPVLAAAAQSVAVVYESGAGHSKQIRFRRIAAW